MKNSVQLIDNYSLLDLDGRRRSDDPYIKHLFGMGLKVSTVFLERNGGDGENGRSQPWIQMIIPVSQQYEFLDTQEMYSWVSLILNDAKVQLLRMNF